VPLVILAGHEYGTGSSADWAAKGTRLLGVKAVIFFCGELRAHSSIESCRNGRAAVAISRRHECADAESGWLGSISITGLSDSIEPGKPVTLEIERKNGGSDSVPVRLRIDTPIEIDYYRHAEFCSLFCASCSLRIDSARDHYCSHGRISVSRNSRAKPMKGVAISRSGECTRLACPFRRLAEMLLLFNKESRWRCANDSTRGRVRSPERHID